MTSRTRRSAPGTGRFAESVAEHDHRQVQSTERAADRAVRAWLTNALAVHSDPAEVARLHQLARWLAG